MENIDTKTIAVIGVGLLIVVGTGWAFKKGYSAQEDCEMLKKAIEDFGTIINQQNQHLGMLNARIAQLEALVGTQPPIPQKMPPPITKQSPLRKQPPKQQPKPKPAPQQRDLPPVEEIDDEEVEEPGPEFDEQLLSELEGDVCDVNGNCKPKKKRAQSNINHSKTSNQIPSS